MLVGEATAAQEQIQKRVDEILTTVIGGMDVVQAIVHLANLLAHAEVAAQYWNAEVEGLKRMRLGAYEHEWQGANG